MSDNAVEEEYSSNGDDDGGEDHEFDCRWQRQERKLQKSVKAIIPMRLSHHQPLQTLIAIHSQEFASNQVRPIKQLRSTSCPSHCSYNGWIIDVKHTSSSIVLGSNSDRDPSAFEILLDPPICQDSQLEPIST